MTTYPESLLTEWLADSGDWFLDDEKLNKGRMTQNLYPYKTMFSPIQINRLTIKNRLVMAPMGNISQADETGRPDRGMIAYFEERAKGGVGLITSGLIPVTFGIDHSLSEPGDLTYFPKVLGSRTFLSGWRDLAHNAHSHGAAFFIQLTAGLGRVGNPQCLMTQKKLPVSASWNPNYYLPAIPCQRLSGRKIRKIVKNMGQAACDAKAATIDGVYLHGHEGYLIEQLTNPAFNRRKIGRYADWQRFGIEMVEEIRKRTGPHFPIMYRIDLSLALNETYGERMNTVSSLKKFRNERTIEQTLDYMKNLVKAGVDMFDVDLGCYDNWWLPHPPMSMKPGLYLDVARLVKTYFKEHNLLSNAGLPVPVVAVGKLGYPDLAEQALRDEDCDMIMLGRPLLADPDWPRKAYAGRVADIRPCIGCQEACINEFVEGGHPTCAVNPRSSFEVNLPKTPPEAPVKKRIAVIGAGPGGFECAMAAHARGHDVHLYDKQAHVGGVVRQGAQPKIKFDIMNYLKWMEHTAERTQQESDRFHLHMNTEATLAMLEDGQFDAIVCATGSTDQLPPVPGMEHAVTARALLDDRSPIEGKTKALVVGAGAVGCEVAYMLAYEHDLEVTVVDMLPYIMPHVCTANRGHLIHYLEKKGVKLYNCTRLLEVRDDGADVERNLSDTVPDPYNTWAPILPENIPNPLAKPIKKELKKEFIEADLVVLATGGKQDQTLFRLLQDAYLTPELYVLGDAYHVGMVMHAVRAGYRTGISL